MSTVVRILSMLISIALAAPAFAESGSAPVELYRAKPVVSGTGEKNRLIGFALALEDVLVKVSGDPRLIGDPRVADLAKDAASMVQEFRYRDRLAGIPIHDEQGSHDRPHDLTTVFFPEKIDEALAALGSRPWTELRPTITVLLGVRNGDRSFLLTSDGERGVDMRDSLEQASVKVAIPVTLPNSAAIDAAGVTEETLAAADPGTLDRLASAAAEATRWSGTSAGATRSSGGLPIGESVSAKRLTLGRSAASASTTPSATPSATPRRCCQETAILIRYWRSGT